MLSSLESLLKYVEKIRLDEPSNPPDIRRQLELLELRSTLAAKCVIALQNLNLGVAAATTSSSWTTGTS